MKKEKNLQDVNVITKLKKKNKRKSKWNNKWIKQSKLMWVFSVLLLIAFILYVS